MKITNRTRGLQPPFDIPVRRPTISPTIGTGIRVVRVRVKMCSSSPHDYICFARMLFDKPPLLLWHTGVVIPKVRVRVRVTASLRVGNVVPSALPRLAHDVK